MYKNIIGFLPSVDGHTLQNGDYDWYENQYINESQRKPILDAQFSLSRSFADQFSVLKTGKVLKLQSKFLEISVGGGEKLENLKSFKRGSTDSTWVPASISGMREIKEVSQFESSNTLL